jgi:SRSO17 transposase
VNQRQLAKLERELTEYVSELFGGLGRSERRENLGLYLQGLMLDGDRKSIEPIARRLVDDETEAEGMRQRLQQAVTVASWSEERVFDRIALKLEAELPGIEALVIDDTGFPKKGMHSVGVQRQYSGTMGRIDNCQVAVSLHLAGEQGSGCIAFRLFLPESWVEDSERCKTAGVPDDLPFQTKIELAIDQLDHALKIGVRSHVVLADAGYGDSHDFRVALDKRERRYVVGVFGKLVVWPPGARPKIPPKRNPSLGGQPRKTHVDPHHPPISITELAPKLRYQHVTWREGARGWQSGRFAAVRIRHAHHHHRGGTPGDEQWLLCQWFDDKPAPSKFWLSNLPATTSVRTLIRLAKLRWRVERDYQEMKEELGLDHFEGRTWRGFHHHAALCAAAHGFLALRRALFPPEHEVDAADGPAGSTAGLASSDRDLSAVP